MQKRETFVFTVLLFLFLKHINNLTFSTDTYIQVEASAVCKVWHAFSGLQKKFKCTWQARNCRYLFYSKQFLRDKNENKIKTNFRLQPEPFNGDVEACGGFLRQCQFRLIFDQLRKQNEATRWLLSLKQRIRSISDHVIHFRILAIEAGWPDLALKGIFYHSLNDNIKDPLCLQPEARTFEELTSAALRSDIRRRERQTERTQISHYSHCSIFSQNWKHCYPQSSRRIDANRTF